MRRIERPVAPCRSLDWLLAGRQQWLRSVHSKEAEQVPVPVPEQAPEQVPVPEQAPVPE